MSRLYLFLEVSLTRVSRLYLNIFLPFFALTRSVWQMLLDHYIRTALVWAIMQRVVVIPYWHFRPSCLFHLQGSTKKDSWPLTMKAISCPEMSVRNYHYSLRYSSEERRSHLLRGGSLKSWIIICLYFDLC